MNIDTINKTITLEDDVNLHDFLEEINNLYPNGKWREFTLKTGNKKKPLSYKHPHTSSEVTTSTNLNDETTYFNYHNGFLYKI